MSTRDAKTSKDAKTPSKVQTPRTTEPLEKDLKERPKWEQWQQTHLWELVYDNMDLARKLCEELEVPVTPSDETTGVASIRILNGVFAPNGIAEFVDIIQRELSNALTPERHPKEVMFELRDELMIGPYGPATRHWIAALACRAIADGYVEFCDDPVKLGHLKYAAFVAACIVEGFQAFYTFDLTACC